MLGLALCRKEVHFIILGLDDLKRPFGVSIQRVADALAVSG